MTRRRDRRALERVSCAVPRRHAGLVPRRTASGLHAGVHRGVIVHCAARLQQPSWLEWVGVVLPMFLFGNWAEWAAHRYPLHSPRSLLKPRAAPVSRRSNKNAAALPPGVCDAHSFRGTAGRPGRHRDRCRAGIGARYAAALAAAGAAVACCDVLDAEPVAARIRDAGGRAIALRVDVTSRNRRARWRPPRSRPRSHRRAGQQRRAVRQPGHETLRPDRRRRMGPRDGGQRAWQLRVRQGSRAADARPGLRQDRQHRIGHGVQGCADAAALRHVQGCRDRDDACAGTRARRCRHPRQHAVAGADRQREHAGQSGVAGGR